MKQLKTTGMIVVCAFLYTAISLSAKEYFVTSPAEITAAMQQAVPGDTLVMKDGEWRDVKIVFSGDGNADHPIVLIAQTPGMVRVKGASYLRIAGSYLTVEGLYFEEGYSPSGSVIEFRDGSSYVANHCRLTSCAIVDFNPALKTTDYKWVSLYGQYNRVDHCYLRGKNHNGTTLVVWMDAIPDYHLIDHNYFASRPELGINGGETIRVGTSDWSMYNSFTTVEYNYFEECNGEAEIISNKSCENVYRYNTFFNSEGTLTLRHGNRCYVYGNYFLGAGNDRAGGVRIIGENHQVYNNYFQDLMGTGFRAALPIMNGVPDSPLNRYFQVKNAKVLFNTFVDCYENFVLGAGADDELTLPPKDCLIANNIISTKFSNEIVTVEDEPVNLSWMSNVFYGSNLGIDLPEGISLENPLLVFDPDSLWRLSEDSPAINAAEGTFEFVVDDMDGQERSAPFDIGADERSESSVLRRPLTGKDVGPDWFPPPLVPEKIRYVQAGYDSLRLAVESADVDEIIELVTDAGVYTSSQTIIIDEQVVIRASAHFQNPPVVQNTSGNDSSKAVFEIREGGYLHLYGVDLDGTKDSAFPVKELVRSGKDPMAKSYSFHADGCVFRDAGSEDKGYFFKAYAGTFADTLKFENCLFYNSAGMGFALSDEPEGSGTYNVKELLIRNCTFWDIPFEVLKLYAGDNIPFTTGPAITVDHVTFDRCGSEGHPVIDARECDFTTIRNSIFTNSDAIVARLYGLAATIDYCDFYDIAPVQLERDARIGTHIFDVDPGYADAGNGDFSLPENSVLIEQGEDGQTLGDLRWAEGLTPVMADTQVDPGIRNFTLYSNYPNPFNGATTISYDLARRSRVEIRIFNTQGQIVGYFAPEDKQAGLHQVRWYPARLSSGVYYCAVKVNIEILVQKMVLVQ